MYQRVIFGEVTHEENRRLTDLSLREWAVLVPLLVLIVWIGVYPSAFTGKTEATISALHRPGPEQGQRGAAAMTDIVFPGVALGGLLPALIVLGTAGLVLLLDLAAARATPRPTWAASRWAASWPRCWWR